MKNFPGGKKLIEVHPEETLLPMGFPRFIEFVSSALVCISALI